MKGVTVKEVNAGKRPELKNFVKFERKLLGKNDNYVSPTDDDIIKMLTGKKHLFKGVEFQLFMAIKDEEEIGRCAAIINRKYQRDKNQQVGSIGLFAAAPNHPEEIKQMMLEAEQWLSRRGIKRIIAPWDGVTGTDSLNVLTHERPMFLIPWHPDYYAQYLQNCGYQPKYERLGFEIDFSSEKYKQAKEKYSHISDFTIRPINKKEWNKDIESIRILFNTTFKEEWECYNYNREEFKEMFDPLKPIVDVNHILLAEKNGKPIGFCFGMTDLAPVFRSFQGKMGIFQIIKLLVNAKKYDRAGILGIGILPEYRGLGITKSMAVKIYSSYEKHGLEKGLYYLVNDYNTRSRKFAESLGGKEKVFCISYEKMIL